jgi:threonine/homoserine/homoserine lactone efflux protein
MPMIATGHLTVGGGRARAVLARSDAIYETLKLIGAAYLVFLGIRTIRERGRLSVDLATATKSAVPRSLATIVREGMTVGFTNPKGLIIFTAVVPAFIDRAQGPGRPAAARSGPGGILSRR